MRQTTGRTLQLLGVLQTGRCWGGGELQARFGVSARTLRRDMDRLRTLGYGIVAVPGLGGGYRLGPGESVPPLILTDEEAVAVAVGLRMGAATVLGGLEDAAAAALGKLERSFGSRTRHRLTALSGAMIPAIDQARDQTTAEVMEAVADAIHQSRQVSADYERHDGTRSRRRLEPHRLIQLGGRWYLVAWDLQRANWRTLRLDRLTPHRPWGPRFTPRPVPENEVRTFTSRSVTTKPYRYQCQIRAQVPVAEARSRFGPAMAEVVDDGRGGTILTAGSDSLVEFAGYLATGGFEFVVLEVGDADALRRALVEVAERLSRAASAHDLPAPRRRPPAAPAQAKQRTASGRASSRADAISPRQDSQRP